MSNKVPAIIYSSLIVFLLLGTLAGYLYPGGHWWEHDYPKYHLWLNFFCDALKTVAYNGESNILGSNIASIAMLVFFIGVLLPTWVALPQRISRSSTVKWINRLGLFSIPCVSLIPLSTFITIPVPHLVVVLIAVVPGVCATGMMCKVIVHEPEASSMLKLLGIANVLLTILIVIWYLVEEITENYSMITPGMPKLLLLTLIIWIIMLLRETTSTARRLSL
jgi:hypothetical protein